MYKIFIAHSMDSFKLLLFLLIVEPNWTNESTHIVNIVSKGDAAESLNKD